MPVFSVRKLAINPPARHIIIQILKKIIGNIFLNLKGNGPDFLPAITGV
jgi:hypothetical protein